MVIKISISKLKSIEDFIKQAKEVHPDKNYGYEKVDYKVAIKEVIIVCPVHGEFKQTPTKHLKGHGCNKCAIIKNPACQSLTTDDFLERLNQSQVSMDSC